MSMQAEMQSNNGRHVRSGSHSSSAAERNPIVVRRELRNYASHLFDYTLKLLDQTANPSSSDYRISDSTTRRREREGSGSSATSSNGNVDRVGASDEVDEGRRGPGGMGMGMGMRRRDYGNGSGNSPTRI